MPRTEPQHIAQDFPEVGVLADSYALLNLARRGADIEHDLRDHPIIKGLIHQALEDQVDALDEFIQLKDLSDVVRVRDIQTRILRGRQLGLWLVGVIEQGRMNQEELSEEHDDATAEEQRPVVDIRRPPKDLLDEG